MRMLIIANAVSGKGVAYKVMPRLKDFFEKNHVSAEFYITKKQRDAIGVAKKAAKSGKYDVISASGGDGTVNEVINGIMLSGRSKKQKFAIIPIGTENVLAKETGIYFNPMDAAKLIVAGKTMKIDIGRAGKRYFVLMAGIGFDAHVATKVQPLLKRMIGSAAYSFAAWNELFSYRHSDITVRIDGKKTVKGSFVVIGNTKLYGAKLKIASKASIKDGLLDVCIFKGKDLISFFRYALGTLTAQHTRFSDIEYLKAKNIRVSSRPKVLCHVDCEVIGKTPIEVSVVPKAINLIVP
ncbi:MAG: diacylglycerol kinase family lipid kinase [Candidatus Woesearchaeota archaeon]|nr:diacylglycerol kinase family lipid kinase [Candidatus Woesearchaeota archaeon]